MFSCDGNKTPGPDGFSMVFFHKSWDFVKNDIKREFDEFWTSGVINGLTN